MGKLVYLALRFLYASIVIGQFLAATADVRNHQSRGEEIEANHVEAIGTGNGVTTQKKFVKNNVFWGTGKFRKFLEEPEYYDCAPETKRCSIYSNDTPECGGSSYCQCYSNIPSPMCLDSRFH